MKKKNVISVLLAMMMATTMLTGCGDSQTADETASVQSGDAQTVASGEAVEIDFWYAGGKTAVHVFQEIVDEFNTSQSDYVINTVTQADYSETYEKLQAGIAGNNAPDMALLGTDAARNLSDKGLIADIAPYVESDTEFDQEDYLSVFFDQGRDDEGKLYSIKSGETLVIK